MLENIFCVMLDHLMVSYKGNISFAISEIVD